MRPPGTLSLLWHWRRGVARVLFAMAVLLVAGVAVLMVLEAAFAPWARSFGLWPTLTGDWHGELRAADGRVALVYFELRGDALSGSRGPSRPHLYGTARWCDDAGRIWNHRLSGRPDNWRGTRFRLSASSEAERESGMALGDIAGDWNGGDEIRASGAVVSLARTATATAARASRTPEPPPVRYTLRRGSEAAFVAACGKHR